MFTCFLVLVSSTCIPAAITDSAPNPKTCHSISEPGVDEDELELSQEAFFSEEEELTPKKGIRPQVIQLPKKKLNSN